MKNRHLLIFFALFSLAHAANAYSGTTLRLPAILGDHMVLQQNTMVNLWGWAAPGDSIEILTGWNEYSYQTKAGTDGRWQIIIQTGPAGGPYEISFRSDTTIVLKDILLGEVWICSGQSNMEWTLSRAQSAQVEVPAADHPDMRLFTVEKRIASRPKEDVIGSWERCSPETAGHFSAVGYFFGKNIHEALGFPVGLINTSWGGTPSEAWTSRETLQNFDYFHVELEKLYNTPVDVLEITERERDSIKNLIQREKDFLNPGNIGMREGWMRPDYDDSGWMEVQCPAEWTTVPEIGILEGVAWMRTRFAVPESWLGKDLMLELGPIDEMDATYLNGRRVGSSTSVDDWDKARSYRIPGKYVTEKEFVLAIRIVNTVSEGGIFGNAAQLRIYPPDEKTAEPVLLAGKWKFRIAYNFPELPQMANPKTPTVLYNGMVHPLMKMTIRGVIWYQGEDNVGRAFQYREIFPAMIRDWRTTWGEGDFPFYFVQLAPFKYGKEFTGAELREAQFLTLSKVKNTGMAVILDIGNPRNIHPTNKRDVGKRLALWALAKDYGKDLVYSGPLYRGQQIEGNSIRIFFDHTGSGLIWRDGLPTHFEIAGADGVYLPALAVIDGHTVLVSNPGIQTPVAVRYGWRNTDEPNLFNSAGLPASSFCTDSWPRITEN
jgi:sialate O-acetylesterase